MWIESDASHCLLRLLFSCFAYIAPKIGGDIFFRNVELYPKYTALWYRRPYIQSIFNKIMLLYMEYKYNMKHWLINFDAKPSSICFNKIKFWFQISDIIFCSFDNFLSGGGGRTLKCNSKLEYSYVEFLFRFSCSHRRSCHSWF
jgi:hypothetical protein